MKQTQFSSEIRLWILPLSTSQKIFHTLAAVAASRGCRVHSASLLPFIIPSWFRASVNKDSPNGLHLPCALLYRQTAGPTVAVGDASNGKTALLHLLCQCNKAGRTKSPFLQENFFSWKGNCQLKQENLWLFLCFLIWNWNLQPSHNAACVNQLSHVSPLIKQTTGVNYGRDSHTGKFGLQMIAGRRSEHWQAGVLESAAISATKPPVWFWTHS